MEEWMEWQNSVKNIKIIVHSIENVVSFMAEETNYF